MQTSMNPPVMAHALGAQCMRHHRWTILGDIIYKNKERARAHALGAQCFSLRKKIKKSDLKNNIEDIKAVVSLFYAG